MNRLPLPLTVCAALLLAAGAAAAAAPPARQTGPHGDRLGEAIAQPLSDLNLSRVKVPPILLKAAEAPYARPATCEAAAGELAELDIVLGPDVDAAAAPGSPARRAAADAAVGAVRDLTTGWLPFRGMVRRLTGAERRAEAVRRAVLAGAVRRGYLKGVAEQMGCAPPPPHN